MAARAEPSVKIVQASVLGAGVLVGLLAGLDPRLAVIVALGLWFAVVTMVNLTAGLCLFAVLTFVDAVIPYGAGALSFVKLIGALLVLAWLGKLAISERERKEEIFSHPALLYVLALFIGWTAVSVTWAEVAAPVAENVYRLVPNAMLFLVVFSAVRRRDQALWVLGAFVAAALMSAAYGVAFPTDPNAVDRLSGAAGNANETAAALVAGAALALGLAASLREPMLRLVAGVGVPLCVLGVFLTLSRGGIIALGVVLVAAVLVAGRRRAAAVALALTVALAGLIYFGAFASPDARARVLELDGGSGRSDIWTVGWRMVGAEPVRGIGAGNFPNTSVHFLLAPGAIVRDDFIVDTPKVAHNTYLEILAELGAVGLALFVGVLAFSLTCAVRAAQAFMRAGDRQMELICRALFVAIVGILASDVFGSRPFSKQLWLLLSIAPALLAVARAQLAAQRQAPEALVT